MMTMLLFKLKLDLAIKSSFGNFKILLLIYVATYSAQLRIAISVHSYNYISVYVTSYMPLCGTYVCGIYS